MQAEHLRAIGLPIVPLMGGIGFSDAETASTHPPQLVACTSPGVAALDAARTPAASEVVGTPAAPAAPMAAPAQAPDPAASECQGKSAWKSYSKIENVDGGAKLMAEVKALDLVGNYEWVATEKVHGANFCFETDGTGVEYASRSSRLGKDADFMNARVTMPKYHAFVLEAFRLAKLTYPRLSRLLIYGEYFGGYYPGLPVVPGRRKVQSGVAYSSEHHFYAFDVSLDGERYLDFDDCCELLRAAGFPLVASPLRRGPLPEVLSIDVESLKTAVPALLGYPPLDKWNIAEGVVVRPARESQCAKLSRGERPILKKKAKAFWEATNQHCQAAKMEGRETETGGTPGPMAAAVELAKGFVNENRLRAVISKSPDLLQETNIHKVVGLFTQDVWQDFSTRHEEELKVVGKEEKAVRKSLGFFIRSFVESQLPVIRADVG